MNKSFQSLDAQLEGFLEMLATNEVLAPSVTDPLLSSL
jgi:hypothetical protein